MEIDIESMLENRGDIHHLFPKITCKKVELCKHNTIKLRIMLLFNRKSTLKLKIVRQPTI